MSNLNPTKPLGVLNLKTGEALQNVFSYKDVTTTTVTTMATSTDPVGGAIGTSLIRVFAEQAFHIKFSATGSTAATKDMSPFAGLTSHYFAVNSGATHVRVIAAGTDGDLWIDQVSQ